MRWVNIWMSSEHIVCVCDRFSDAIVADWAAESKKNRFILTWINVNEIEDFFLSLLLLLSLERSSGARCLLMTGLRCGQIGRPIPLRVVFIIRQFSSTFRLSVILPHTHTRAHGSIVSCFCANVCDLCTKQPYFYVSFVRVKWTSDRRKARKNPENTSTSTKHSRRWWNRIFRDPKRIELFSLSLSRLHSRWRQPANADVK